MGCGKKKFYYVYHLHTVMEMSVTARWQWVRRIRSDGAFGSLSYYARFSLTHPHLSIRSIIPIENDGALRQSHDKNGDGKENEIKSNEKFSSHRIQLLIRAVIKISVLCLAKCVIHFHLLKVYSHSISLRYFSYYFLSFISLLQSVPTRVRWKDCSRGVVVVSVHWLLCM